MHTQRIALTRWLIWHRRQLAAGTALIAVSTLLVFMGPLLLAVAALEWKRARRRNRLLGLALTVLLARTVIWLWHELRNLPHGAWHPCAQCGTPIEGPSKAWYCSPGCRRYARLEHASRGGDEQAAARLERLRRSDRYDPALAEVPF
jgi:hypothetical protein